MKIKYFCMIVIFLNFTYAMNCASTSTHSLPIDTKLKFNYSKDYVPRSKSFELKEIVTNQPRSIATQTSVAEQEIISQQPIRNPYSFVLARPLGSDPIYSEYVPIGCLGCSYRYFGHEYDYSRIMSGGINIAPNPSLARNRTILRGIGHGICTAGCIGLSRAIPAVTGIDPSGIFSALGSTYIAQRYNLVEMWFTDSDTRIARQVIENVDNKELLNWQSNPNWFM